MAGNPTSSGSGSATNPFYADDPYETDSQIDLIGQSMTDVPQSAAAAARAPRQVGFASEDSFTADPRTERHPHFNEDASNSSPFEDDSNNTDKKFRRVGSRVGRNRWGTQRHPDGRPVKDKPPKKLNRKNSAAKQSKKVYDVPDDLVLDEDRPTSRSGNAEPSMRRIFFNTPLPADAVDPKTGHPLEKFERNKIRTTKYTPLSFLPKNLAFQFKNVANIYFLFIVILGAFSIFGVQSPGLAAVPIIVIVIITAFKDALEDYRRTLLDYEVNSTRTELLVNTHNYNVVDDDISAWRKFKKANSRLVIRIGRWFRTQKAIRKYKKTGVMDDRYKKYVVNKENSNDDASSYHDGGASLDDQYALGDVPAGGYNPNPFADPSALGTDESVVNPLARPATNGKFQADFWKNVKVGDFLRITSDQEIPADMVILSTSDADGACFIETKNLDGETNLKVRQALHCGAGIKHASDCQKAEFSIDCEEPLPNLYAFNGVAKWHTASGHTRSEPISINNLLMRGCTLRNTGWVIGAVVYTGMDTKIMLNAGITPTKRSRLQRELNRYVVYNFAIMFAICLISGLVNGFWHGKSATSDRVFQKGMIGGVPAGAGVITFLASVILYQSLVPISLYISIEIVKTIQAFYIFSDVYMYYDKIDYPPTPKSWNISDDLGQIEYVFSDKTGTLTQNVMEFKKCSINGVAYGKAYTEALAGMRKREGIDVEAEAKAMKIEIAEDKERMLRRLEEIHPEIDNRPDELTFVSASYVEDLQGASGEEQAQANYHFMLALALCNSVITEEAANDPNRKIFKAQSPDEAALVGAARDVDFALMGRTRRGVLIRVQGEEKEYQILNTLEFNSTRKRMSAIVKLTDPATNEEKIILICKGADSVIYERLEPDMQKELREKTAVQLESFASEGLRTLCIAQREISLEEYLDWNERHEQAATAINDRDEQLEEVASSIECHLTLLGGTAIEDRLQDGVPSTISLLADGGIKLWVLTGDKIETAINIGFSCNLLDNSMELLVIRVENEDPRSVVAVISELLEKHFGLEGSQSEVDEAKRDHSVPEGKFAVVIDGNALAVALNPAIQHKFLLLCKQCRSVLCCRVSPAQKAAVVRMVRTGLGVMTLSIGDGANDVAMIQEADVGVGIAGEEGRQAVMCSDYAFGQFRYLSRLMLVHGRWSYKRLAEMIPNFFYKNVVFSITLFWFGCFDSFDATYLYEYTFLMFFNLAFTSLPVIFMGFMDQDVPDKISLAVPQLYRRGILRAEFSEAKFWQYMWEGLYQSAIAFFFPYFCYWHGNFQDPSGRPVDHRFWLGLNSLAISVFSCNFFVLSNQYRWDWLTLTINGISSLLVFVWTGIYTSFVSSGSVYHMASEVFGSLSFWAVSLVGTAAAVLPHVCGMVIRALWTPFDVDIIREQMKLGEFNKVLAVPQAADDPDAAKYQNPYRTQPDSSIKPGRPKWNFARASKQPEQLYFSGEESLNQTLALSPSYVNVGGRVIPAERHSFSDEHRNRNSSSPSRVEEDPEPLVAQTPASFAPTPSWAAKVSDDDFDWPQVTAKDHARTRASTEMKRSLDAARESSRYEQTPPQIGIDQIRTSVDMGDDVLIAENLMEYTGRKSQDISRPVKHHPTDI